MKLQTLADLFQQELRNLHRASSMMKGPGDGIAGYAAAHARSG